MDGSELLGIFRTDAGGPLWAQAAFAAGWVLAAVLWAGLYHGAVDPALRRWLAGRVGEPVVWVLRRGSQSGGDRWLRPRHDTWGWGLAPREDVPVGKDLLVYVASVLVVYVAAGLAPVAVLCAVAFGTRLLSPPFVLALFFLAIPLYGRFVSGRWHAAGVRAGQVR